ncbi:hypothetical protein [Actinoplanes sp. NPDC049681]|uniref:hypothetical protein n=1 Tax=Actinoplanes sp. NPDC049681 TaxID=3363905 RepID=UPI00379B7D00
MKIHCRKTGKPSRLGFLLPFVLLAIAACAGKPGQNAENLRIATDAEVRAEVQELANQIANVSGKGRLARPDVNSSECDNDEGDTSGAVKYIQGVYNIDIPAAKQRDAFNSVREHWQKMGWKITRNDFRQDLNEGVLSAKNQGDSGNFTLSSTTSADSLAVIIHSGCFRETQPTTPPSR